MHLENLDSKKQIIHAFIAAQGSQEGVTKYLRDIKTTKKVESSQAKDADDLLAAFNTGFKGLV